MNDAIQLFLVLAGIVGAGSIGYLAFGAVRIAVRRMERRAGLAAQQGGGGDSADLEARVAALEEATSRLAELEERVDFAERMLARQREADRLNPGGP
jgi:hypothetical protein